MPRSPARCTIWPPTPSLRTSSAIAVRTFSASDSSVSGRRSPRPESALLLHADDGRRRCSKERDVEAIGVVLAIADAITVIAALDGATAGGAHSVDRVVGGEIHLRLRASSSACQKPKQSRSSVNVSAENAISYSCAPFTISRPGLLRLLAGRARSEEHTSELQSIRHPVCPSLP